LGTTARELATTAGTLAPSLSTNATDLATLSGSLTAIETDVGEVARQVRDFDHAARVGQLIAGGLLLLGLLAGWLAVGAVLCIWFGRRLRAMAPADTQP
ncbi:MAG: hypothetical protein KF809_03990, partial [Chloroflexi bacterium]|nr:hypothetical protein [Chloroflexota bacterium]